MWWNEERKVKTKRKRHMHSKMLKQNQMSLEFIPKDVHIQAKREDRNG